MPAIAIFDIVFEFRKLTNRLKQTFFLFLLRCSYTTVIFFEQNKGERKVG